MQPSVDTQCSSEKQNSPSPFLPQDPSKHPSADRHSQSCEHTFPSSALSAHTPLQQSPLLQCESVKHVPPTPRGSIQNPPPDCSPSPSCAAGSSPCGIAWALVGAAKHAFDAHTSSLVHACPTRRYPQRPSTHPSGDAQSQEEMHTSPSSRPPHTPNNKQQSPLKQSVCSTQRLPGLPSPTESSSSSPAATTAADSSSSGESTPDASWLSSSAPCHG
mmetsp:Transcript_50041/g.102046  ORF Transcript_50041/g.102046 Transcript_50041/m.102046 type:complete len:217 (+) Transcript_50041:1033-1683(+)